MDEPVIGRSSRHGQSGWIPWHIACEYNVWVSVHFVVSWVARIEVYCCPQRFEGDALCVVNDDAHLPRLIVFVWVVKHIEPIASNLIGVD